MPLTKTQRALLEEMKAAVDTGTWQRVPSDGYRFTIRYSETRATPENLPTNWWSGETYDRHQFLTLLQSRVVYGDCRAPWVGRNDSYITYKRAFAILRDPVEQWAPRPIRRSPQPRDSREASGRRFLMTSSHLVSILAERHVDRPRAADPSGAGKADRCAAGVAGPCPPPTTPLSDGTSPSHRSAGGTAPMSPTDPQRTTVRGLLIPATAGRQLSLVEFTPDQQGHLPQLRQHFGNRYRATTVLSAVDFVTSYEFDSEQVNVRAVGASTLLHHNVAEGEHDVPDHDRERARRVLAGDLPQPQPRGPVLLLGVDLDTGNFTSAPEDMMIRLLSEEPLLMLIALERAKHLVTA